MSVKKRLKLFASSEGLTVSAFEKSINVSNGYINSISKSIGIEKLNDILEVYPNLDLYWLLTGKENDLTINDKELDSELIHDYKNKYIEVLEENRELQNESRVLYKENKRLSDLLSSEDFSVFQTPKIYAVAEDAPKEMARPKKELKKHK